MQASIFIVLHLPKHVPSHLDAVLSASGPIPATFAKNGDFIEHGTIYIAPPEFHLLLHKNVLTLSKGPRENLWRPSINTLFRSAAVAYGTRVVGIILSGYLDDGVAGLLAVQRCGGITMVQEPGEAQFPDMPRNVLAHLHVDYCLPVDKLARQLIHQMNTPVKAEVSPPEDLIEETLLVDAFTSNIHNRQSGGEASGISCPECGGPLWQTAEGPVNRYRCHIGHGFSEHSLLSGKTTTLDQAIWTAFRLMEERISLLRKLIANTEQNGLHHTIRLYQKDLAALLPQLQQFRELLKEKPRSRLNETSPLCFNFFAGGGYQRSHFRGCQWATLHLLDVSNGECNAYGIKKPA